MSTQSELDPRTEQSIQAALAGSWSQAAELNNALFEDYPEDINILNRLGHAYTELGQINKANQTYKKVLEIDPYNPIATKNMEKLSALRGADIKPKETRAIDPDIFLEEPGKTKTIALVDLAMPKVLIQLRVGDNLTLNLTKTDVTIISEDSKRLGKLEPIWGKEVSQAMSLGSEFSAIVKSLRVGKKPEDSIVSVFLREQKRSKKLAHPTFPIDTNFTPYVREETLNQLNETTPHKTDSEEDEIEEVLDQEEETPRDEVPQEAAEFVPTPDLVEDEEAFQELK